MKEASKLKNYRTKFKRYYGIDFSNEYEVHHIDLDRSNNRIENLLLLPKDLHKKYHSMMQQTEHNAFEKYERIFDARIYGNVVCKNSYEIMMLENLIEVLRECSIWYDYKMYLDGKCPNIHGIILK